MRAQEQIFDSGNIFRLWSKCILYCFQNSGKLQDHSYTHKTSLHPIWHHFIDPFDHQYYFKFLVSRDVCEASAILACPFSMIFLKHINMSKLSSFAKWYDTWWAFSYDQMTMPCPIGAQLDTPCECILMIFISGPSMQLWSNCSKSWSF